MNFRIFSLFFQIITALIYGTLHCCESKTCKQVPTKANDITTPIIPFSEQLGRTNPINIITHTLKAEKVEKFE